MEGPVLANRDVPSYPAKVWSPLPSRGCYRRLLPNASLVRGHSTAGPLCSLPQSQEGQRDLLSPTALTRARRRGRAPSGGLGQRESFLEEPGRACWERTTRTSRAPRRRPCPGSAPGSSPASPAGRPCPSTATGRAPFFQIGCLIFLKTVSEASEPPTPAPGQYRPLTWHSAPPVSSLRPRFSGCQHDAASRKARGVLPAPPSSTCLGIEKSLMRERDGFLCFDRVDSL